MGGETWRSIRADDPRLTTTRLACGLKLARLYTRPVRRWICIIALLAGFTREDYVWSARVHTVAPTEMPIDRMPMRGREVQPWDWWLLP